MTSWPEALKKKGRVLLCLPEGLMPKAHEWVERLESEGLEVFVDGNPAYGSCQIPLEKARVLGAGVLHVGHHEMFPRRDCFYLEYRLDVGFEELKEEALKELSPFKSVGLFTNLQHVHKLKELKDWLEASGKRVLIGKHGSRTKYDGQVLGCEMKSALSVSEQVDAFVYFGGGLFHPIMVRIACEKPVLKIDPFEKRCVWVEARSFLKRRFALIQKAKEAESFGILVSIFPGQMRLELAKKAKRMIEEREKKAYLIVCDYIVPEALENFAFIHCFVNTACPRIAYDDYERFSKPVITFKELEIVLGLRRWDDYELDLFEP